MKHASLQTKPVLWNTGQDLKWSTGIPSALRLKPKLDTDLFEFAKNKTYPMWVKQYHQMVKNLLLSVEIEKLGFLTFVLGNCDRIFDETLQRFSELQQMTQQLPKYGIWTKNGGKKENWVKQKQT